jgi:glutathione synthase/RimK-type ligase-like ATP-grasp enzyme
MSFNFMFRSGFQKFQSMMRFSKSNNRPSLHSLCGRTITLKRDNAPQRLKEVALRACSVIGKGLYGVDIKEINGNYVVVEVNDNPAHTMAKRI